MNYEIKLSARLAAAASFAKPGSAADIGTDHALLPIALIFAGHDRALASDLNEGPCLRAAANIQKYGLSDKITVACTPGLNGIENFAPDNIFICGMGGEMITGILAESDYPKKSRCRLILQPMTMPEVLRKYLCDEGFSIIDERVVYDEGKYYQLIAAEFDGVKRTLREFEYRLGRLNLENTAAHRESVYFNWLTYICFTAQKRIDGRNKALSPVEGQDVDIELVKIAHTILNGGTVYADG